MDNGNEISRGVPPKGGKKWPRELKTGEFKKKKRGYGGKGTNNLRKKDPGKGGKHL